jgi:hypothetical protein
MIIAMAVRLAVALAAVDHCYSGLNLSALQARGLSPLFYRIKVALTHLKTAISWFYMPISLAGREYDLLRKVSY